MAAPINIKTELKLELRRYAIAIPGNTLCEIASPTITVFLNTKKQPNNEHETAIVIAVNNVRKSFNSISIRYNFIMWVSFWEF